MSVVFVGFVASFAMVPIQTSMQVLPPEGMRGQVIAFNNMLSFITMFIAGLLYQVSSELGLNPGSTMLFSGLVLLGYLWHCQKDLAAVELPRDSGSGAE